MDPPPSSSVPRSGEDLSRAFRNLPPGTLSGLDALCDHNYWLSVMREAEIEISNEDIFRFRFSEISKTASNRLAFLAGSGEYGTFNLRYLIRQLVEQCSDMHKYTRKLEKYVVKLQQRVELLEAERGPSTAQRGEQPLAAAQQRHDRYGPDDSASAAAAGGGGSGPGGSGAGAGGGGGGGGASQRGGNIPLPPQFHALLPPPAPLTGLAAGHHSAYPGPPQSGAGLLPPHKRQRPQGPGSGEAPGAQQEDDV